MADTHTPPPSEAEPARDMAQVDPRTMLLQLAWDLEAQLSWLREAGVEELPQVTIPRASPQESRPLQGGGGGQAAQARTSTSARAATVQGQGVARSPKAATSARVEVPDRLADTLEALREEVSRCERCPLAKSRAGVVLGNGVARSDLMFVGERPFVGADGAPRLFAPDVQALLDKMIQAMGHSPAEVACADVIQCVPSESDMPCESPTACRALLWTQIAIIKPKVIVALGKLAAQTLLQVSTPITRLRGEWQNCAGIRLMPTYHPAYLLKHPDAKRQAWNDLRQVMAVLKEG